MQSIGQLVELLLQDCGRECGAPHVDRDVRTLRQRVEHEGESFLTLTLPSFCRDFERCLDAGRVVPGSFASFKKKRSGIPAFLSGFLHRVFDTDGVLLPNAPVVCIRAVRQICLYCKKVERPCSDARVKTATEAYVECDKDVRDPVGPLRHVVRHVGRLITASLDLHWRSRTPPFVGGIGATHARNGVSPLRPRHGPGTTQERILGNRKFVHRRWHQRLRRVGFSWAIYGRGSPLFGRLGEPPESWLDAIPQDVEPGDEAPVRVTFVPKTLRSPRVIAVEPVCMQYAQQALRDRLVQQLENGRYTSGRINFADQSVNQRLALDASSGGHLATLDMSEASDRVGVVHVLDCFEGAPSEFLELLFASRSTRAELPDGRILSLRKFASMGSATCFPVEALVFFVNIVASRIYRSASAVNARTVHEMSRDVYVYGDDLIVPADEAPAICDDLEAMGFKVNRHKSFWNGHFRESCGVDAYRGESVTPIYMRRDLPTGRDDVVGLLSAVATANQLWEAGRLGAANALRKCVERYLGPLPQVPPDSPAIGWTGYSSSVPRTRWNASLQRKEIFCWTVRVPRGPDPLDGDPALLKCLRLIGGTPINHLDHTGVPDLEHLSTSPRSRALALKRGWVPAL